MCGAEPLSLHQGYLPSRELFYSTLAQAAVNLGFVGTLSWQVSM